MNPYSIKLEYQPMMLFPSQGYDKVFNRWNEVHFKLTEDPETSRLFFKAGYKGASPAFECHLDLHSVISTGYAANLIAETWRTCTVALARHLSDLGDPWFLDNWDLFDTKYLKHIQVEHNSGYSKDNEFRTIASTFAKAVPNIGNMVVCPECDMEDSIYTIIMHRNDIHKMSREDIADWLDTLPFDLTVGGNHE